MSVANIARIRGGNHTDHADLTSTPGTLYILDLLRAEGLGPRGRLDIERKRNSVDGGKFPRINGVKDCGPFKLGFDLTSMDSNNGGAYADLKAKSEYCWLWDSFFGAAAPAIVGAAPTFTSFASKTLTVSSTVIANGDIIWLNTSTGWHARYVVSGGGTVNPVIDRALTGAVVAGSTIYRSQRHNLNTSVVRHVPTYIDVEYLEANDAARKLVGCFAESLEFKLPTEGACEFDITLHPNDWDDIAASNPTTYTAPAKGQVIVVEKAPFYIGDFECLIEEASLSIKHTLKIRTPTKGTNGRHGILMVEKEAMLSGFFAFADNALSIGELVDDSGTVQLGELYNDDEVAGSARDVYDVGLQIGQGPGAGDGGIYFSMPAADIVCKPAVERGGDLMVPFTAYATRPSTADVAHALRIGVT